MPSLTDMMALERLERHYLEPPDDEYYDDFYEREDMEHDRKYDD